MAPRRSRGKRQSGRQLTIWKKWYTGAFGTGSTIGIGRKNLEFANDRSFKVISAHIEVVSTGPTLIQLRGYGPIDSQSAIAQSGPFVARLTPRRHTLRINSPWYSRDTPSDRTLIAVNVLCPKKSDSQWVIYMITLTVQLSPEMVPGACPKSLKAVASEDFYEAMAGRNEANPN